MARAQRTDFLHNMRFHVEITSLGQGANTANFLKGGTADYSSTPAGFMSVTTPDVSVAPVMYKEGCWVYERKYPGEPSMGGDIVMDRGVARGDSSFWHWIRVVIEGSGEYRADLQIKHYHREQALTRPVNQPGNASTGVNKTAIELASPARIYHVFDAFPIAHALTGGTLAATDGEISVMSITCAYERFEVEELPVT